ncbi:MAG TPA: hypothetical protein VIH95_05925 [Acidimicrobiales bacterium]|jgi:hypothetical protein
MTELEEAISLSTEERRAAFERFFDAHPGGSRPAPGYGRALIDFLAWEVDSGRVVGGGGSVWWKAVNGSLALDLRDALDSSGETQSSTRPAVAAWTAYASAPSGEEQRTLWQAHDRSIARGVVGAAALLEDEEPAEQSFSRLVLRVLHRATETSEPTDTPALGESVRRRYPRRYPIGPEELDGLVAAMSRGADPRGTGLPPPRND